MTGSVKLRLQYESLLSKEYMAEMEGQQVQMMIAPSIQLDLNSILIRFQFVMNH